MKQLSGKVFKTVLLLAFLAIGSNGCKKDYVSIIPYVPVNMDLNPTSYIELNVPGGSVYFPNVGYGGIILFRDLTDSSNPFLAFDACCTHEVSQSIRVTVDGSGVATCPKCGSEFVLFGGSGSASKGPAIEPLKQYHTSFVGGRIIVRN